MDALSTPAYDGAGELARSIATRHGRTRRFRNTARSGQPLTAIVRHCLAIKFACVFVDVPAVRTKARHVVSHFTPALGARSYLVGQVVRERIRQGFDNVFPFYFGRG
jgi:hypothetical protein